MTGPVTDNDLARWERLGREAKVDRVRGISKLTAAQRIELMRFFGQQIEQERQRGCPHWEYKGIDQTPCTNPAKRWRCTHCGKLR